MEFHENYARYHAVLTALANGLSKQVLDWESIEREGALKLAFMLSAYRLHRNLQKREENDQLVPFIRMRYSKTTGFWKEINIDEDHPLCKISFGKKKATGGI